MYIGTMHIDTAEINIVYTMPSTTPKIPNKRIETLFPQISKIRLYAINYTDQQQVLFCPLWSIK